MAHVMKYTKAACGHMFAHFDRKAEHISNDDLDRTRTHLNYNLAAHQRMEQGEFVRKRCSEVKCQNRKDVNVMVSWVITAPKDLPEQEHKVFFQASYDFLQQRYGRENVVSAYVHMDEITPHMHFAFVPVVQDRKRGGQKVSAKEAVNRSDLQKFHTDLQKYLERELGHKVSVLNEATKDGNKSVRELKRESAAEQLQEVQEQIEAIKCEADSLCAAIVSPNVVKEAQEAAKRSLTGSKVQIPTDTFNRLVGAAKASSVAKLQAEQMKQAQEAVKDALEQERREKLALQEENRGLKVRLQESNLQRDRYSEKFSENAITLIRLKKNDPKAYEAYLKAQKEIAERKLSARKPTRRKSQDIEF